MPDRTEEEEMLSKILRDPRWSLPAWPDAERRIRRTARRQRLTATSAAAGLSAAAVLAVALPAIHLGGTPAVPAGPGRAYVLSERVPPDSTVTVIDTTTSRPVGSIRVAGGGEMAVAPDGKTVYVAGRRGLVPIAAATSKPGRLIRVPGGVGYFVITPNGKTAYLTNDISGEIIPVNLATGRLEKTSRVTGEILALAVTPNGKTVYVLSSNFVTPISTATNTAGRPVVLGAQPTAIAITPDGRTAYVAMGSVVVPIRTATSTALKRIRFPGRTVNGIDITPSGKTAYVSMNGQVVPIRTATNTALRPISFGRNVTPDEVAITPDGKTGYVIFEPVGRDVVTPINIATNRALPPITTGKSPFMIAITADGKTAYVANYGDLKAAGTLVPLDTATGRVGRPIAVRQPVTLIVTSYSDTTS